MFIVHTSNQNIVKNTFQIKYYPFHISLDKSYIPFSWILTVYFPFLKCFENNLFWLLFHWSIIYWLQAHLFLLFACKLLLKTSWQSENKCLGVPCNTYLSTNTYSSRRVREKFFIKKFWPFFNIKKREPLCVNINTKLLFFFGQHTKMIHVFK